MLPTPIKPFRNSAFKLCLDFSQRAVFCFSILRPPGSSPTKYPREKRKMTINETQNHYKEM